MPELTSPPHTMPTVLVADDEIDLVLLMTRQLRRAGYAVITAADGAEAHTMAQAHRPDAAVFDVQMPGMGGIEALELLQADPATASIPVILVSAGFQEHTVRRGLDAGAEAYLNKPLTERDLLAYVARAIDRTSYGRAVTDPAEFIASSWPNHESDIRSRIIEMLGPALDEEDRDLLTGLVARFPGRADELLDQLDRAAASGDASLVTHAAHSLRGCVANCGAANIARLLEAIEVDASCGVLDEAAARLLDVRAELGPFSANLQHVVGHLGS